MTHTIINPETLHNPVGYGYSHIARASGEMVFIAGQYASDGEGHVTSDDFADQVRRSFENMGTALAAAGLDYRHVVQIRTFIVDHDMAKLEILAKAVQEIWEDLPPTQTLIGVAALALPGMLFEVDAVAFTEDGS
ncbi:RidA family protein [Streptosporangium sandarakinum]|uniref:RidA family protein n=1 Tax=Streptosporangium sandarakinum TaxID=1260955 RepID=UPI0033AC6BEE